MSDGYEALMADLLAMSRTFTKESQTLSTAVSAAGVSAPDGGDATINAALAATLQAAGLTTGQLGAVVASHGTKLDGAYQQYREAEESNVRLCQQLTSLITGE